MVTSGWQNAVKFTHVISKGSRQQLVLCNVAAFFLLEEHSKGNWGLKVYSKETRAFEGYRGTWALRNLRQLGTQRKLRHSNTQGNWALGHLGIFALKGSGT